MDVPVCLKGAEANNLSREAKWYFSSWALASQKYWRGDLGITCKAPRYLMAGLLPLSRSYMKCDILRAAVSSQKKILGLDSWGNSYFEFKITSQPKYTWVYLLKLFNLRKGEKPVCTESPKIPRRRGLWHPEGQWEMQTRGPVSSHPGWVMAAGPGHLALLDLSTHPWVGVMHPKVWNSKIL